MITIVKKITGIAVLLAFVSGCSGGGGGNGEGSSAATGIRILHAAIDHAPLVARSSLDAETDVQRTMFAEAAKYGELAAGPQIVQVMEVSRPGQALFSFDLEVKKNERRSLLVFGGPTTRDGFQARMIQDAPPAAEQGKASLRVINGADNAFQVEVRIDGNPSDYLGLGEDSAYTQLPAGAHTVVIKRTEDDKRLAQISPVLEEGKAYTFLLAGDGDYFVSPILLED